MWFDSTCIGVTVAYRSVILQMHGCDITHGGVQQQTWRGIKQHPEGSLAFVVLELKHLIFNSVHSISYASGYIFLASQFHNNACS